MRENSTRAAALKRYALWLAASLGMWLIAPSGSAQTSVPAAAPSAAQPVAQTVKGPDDRMKADILLVVAHPDDEGGATPYLARAIFDEHKRVAVVYTTRGGSGGNDYSREHGPALADIREQEARRACAMMGIENVWFLQGKDTASQNVLNSLGNWGHGANLEELVRIVRLTRPEVIITWLPGVFVGEDHGDHQAAGVLATEAFDSANDPTAFPSQIAGASKRLELYLENLGPWQPKRIYYFSDADDQNQFAGTGPAYSVKEISPAKKKPYWVLALLAGAPHLTQFAEAAALSKMSDEQLAKFVEDPNNMFWPEPMVLTFGKSVTALSAVAPIFAGEATVKQTAASANSSRTVAEGASAVSLAGPWAYYREFRRAHKLENLPLPAEGPEIAVKPGSVLQIPYTLKHSATGSQEFNVKVAAPAGWTVASGAGLLRLPQEESTALQVEVKTPEGPATSVPAPVEITVEQNGQALGTVRLLVKLKTSGVLPQ